MNNGQNQRHLRAFEYWMVLGGASTDEMMGKVAVELQCSRRTIWNWYRKFEWENERDHRIAESKRILRERYADELAEQMKYIRDSLFLTIVACQNTFLSKMVRITYDSDGNVIDKKPVLP